MYFTFYDFNIESNFLKYFNLLPLWFQLGMHPLNFLLKSDTFKQTYNLNLKGDSVSSSGFDEYFFSIYLKLDNHICHQWL